MKYLFSTIYRGPISPFITAIGAPPFFANSPTSHPDHILHSKVPSLVVSQPTLPWRFSAFCQARNGRKHPKAVIKSPHMSSTNQLSRYVFVSVFLKHGSLSIRQNWGDYMWLCRSCWQILNNNQHFKPSCQVGPQAVSFHLIPSLDFSLTVLGLFAPTTGLFA